MASTPYESTFCEWLTKFIKKSKQFNQSDIASNIRPLTLTLSVNEPLRLCDRCVYYSRVGSKLS